MQIWEVILIGIALAMDAVAVGMTDGMAEPQMGKGKMFAAAGAFALFQFGMPVFGYYGGYAFSGLIARIAPYLSFAILVLLGGNMILECVREERRHAPLGIAQKSKLTPMKLFGQAVATSLDALAVGVTFLATEQGAGLPAHAAVCALVIGVVTFVLTLPAVVLGRSAAKRLAGRAEIAGGAVLIVIGCKLLLEGVM